MSQYEEMKRTAHKFCKEQNIDPLVAGEFWTDLLDSLEWNYDEEFEAERFTLDLIFGRAE